MSTIEVGSSLSFVEQEHDEPVVVEIAGGTVVIYSASRPGTPELNEDSAMVISVSLSQCVLAVADGAGGHASGGKASRVALESLEASVRSRDPASELRAAILDGIELANESVRALSVGAGTTLAVAEIQDRWVRTYHVGDTGILITGSKGRIRTRTLDHSPAGHAVEAGMMNEDEAMHHEERHVLTNVVGSESMRIEIGPSLKLSPRDTVLLASDGLFDNLVFREIVDGIRKGPLKEGVRAIVHVAQQRMQEQPDNVPSKPDDLTLIAYRRDRS